MVAGGAYVYNIVAAADPNALTGAIGHIWSLTVEEQFYFLWPLLLVAVLKRATRRADTRLIIGSVLLIAVFFFIRGHFQYMVVDPAGEVPKFADADNPTWQGFIYRFASMRPDMIVYGCLIAIVTRAIPRPIPTWFRRFLMITGPLSWVWFVTVLFLANSGIWGFELWGGPAYQVALLALGPGILDTYFRRETLYTRAVSWKPISWLGVRAYGVYLWHVIPLLILVPLMGNVYGVPKLMLGLIGSAAGVLIGLGSFRFIERRFLAMKERFSGVPVQSTPAPADGVGRPVPDTPLEPSSDTDDAPIDLVDAPIDLVDAPQQDRPRTPVPATEDPEHSR